MTTTTPKTKKERLEEIQYSLNQILVDVRELKDE